jgi:transcriptional regulator with GAF, ATPase, and Fis domain
MMEEMGSVLSRDELLASYRSANRYVGDRASQSDLERLRRCGRLIMDNIESLQNVQEELIGGTFEQEVNHFEARLIARALEQGNGSVTRAARSLGLTHQGLCKIIDGRHSKTLAGARRPKRVRRKSRIRKN